MTKICSTCNIEKPLDCFGKAKQNKDGYKGQCKNCKAKYNIRWQKDNQEHVLEYRISYYKENREEIVEKNTEYVQKNKEKTKEYQVQYRNNNRETINQDCRDYYQENREEILVSKKEYYKTHKEEKLEYNRSYDKKRRKEDPAYKLACNLRSRMGMAIKKGYKAGSAVRDLGCSIEFFKAYIESLFQPGMTWENHGPDGWHLDHKKPLSSFDLTNREQFLEACHYTNIQPLWALDNLKKGDKIYGQEAA